MSRFFQEIELVAQHTNPKRSSHQSAPRHLHLQLSESYEHAAQCSRLLPRLPNHHSPWIVQ